ncbi:very-long-chain enoyl-CoA reductase [Elysia marginata]|uniref:Very-long-chain enoyl-CoA reductase n=1 Tax=Elysia marginata TaxID=1093978 RepID=A0AAV4JWR5_9GAST|nr:very-long-chain enoyl-CoA reductase [Elysia marginata]
MSAAFDTINRSQILDILKTIIKEDELRIIRLLLSNTEINTKINGSSKAMPFMSNVSTHQGDSLSPVLFTIYLENALREIRTTLPKPNSSYGREIPSELAYAVDVDFIGHDCKRQYHQNPRDT